MKICVSRILVFGVILLSPLMAFAGSRYGVLYGFCGNGAPARTGRIPKPE